MTILSLNIISKRILELQDLRSQLLSLHKESGDDRLAQSANLISQVIQSLETESDFLSDHRDKIYE